MKQLKIFGWHWQSLQPCRVVVVGLVLLAVGVVVGVVVGVGGVSLL